ncbi:MAG: helicase-associated domain-containing protein [Deltaproteobacteria bacterium]|nr:helicase-associated domain-containing protein [Deltaproteobacteria bacterium]
MRKTAERRQGKGRTRERGSFASTLAELIRPETARHLVERFDGDPGPAAGDGIDRLAAVLQDPALILTRLRRLPPPALVLLEILCEIPGRMLSVRACREEVDRRLGREGWGVHAVNRLREAGLSLSPADDEQVYAEMLTLPGILADVLGPHVAALTLREVPPSTVRLERRGDDRPVELRLALLVGSFWNDPPRVTADGEVFKTARDKLARVYFPGDEEGLRRLDRLISLARVSGLLEFGVNSLLANRSACAEWTALEPARRAGIRLSLAARSLFEDGRRALAVLSRTPGEGWVYADDLVARMSPSVRAVDPAGWWRPGDRCDAEEAARRSDATLRSLRRLPEVERGETEDGREVLRVPPALRGREKPAVAGRAYVQPNFEVLLPPETDVARALGIASIAEVRRIEDVATLVLTPAAVRRARDNGLGREEILAALEAVAPGAVPQNVAATVADWAGGPKAARLIDGAVLYCPDPAGAAKARTSPEVAGLLGPEVGPGIWAIDRFQLNRLAAALGTAGIEHVARPIRLQSADPYGTPRRPLRELASDFVVERENPEPDAELRRAVEGTRSTEPPPAPEEAVARPAGKGGPGSVRKALPKLARPMRPMAQRDSDNIFDDDDEGGIADEFDDDLDDGLPAPIPPPRRRWVSTPSQGTLRLICKMVQGLCVELKWLDGAGGEARRDIVVDRVAARRGMEFVDGYAPDDAEGVSIPLHRIIGLAGVDEESALALEAFIDTGRALETGSEPPKVGRNDPCPCGSGRRYKRCCGR